MYNVRCIACEKFTFKGAPKEWLDQGYGNCALREKFVMFGAVKVRDCGTFVPADAETVGKREVWIKEREG